MVHDSSVPIRFSGPNSKCGNQRRAASDAGRVGRGLIRGRISSPAQHVCAWIPSQGDVVVPVLACSEQKVWPELIVTKQWKGVPLAPKVTKDATFGDTL